MVHFGRAAFLITLFCTVMVWSIIASPTAAGAHGAYADTGVESAADKQPRGGASNGVPEAQHSDDQHCHGTGSLCHFYAVAHAGQWDWPLRKDHNLLPRRSHPTGNRSIIPLLRPPRD
jgi:hypothetical protein